MAEQSLRLRLELVTPHGPVFQDDVNMVIIPGVAGELGVLPRHAPIITRLTIGRLRVLDTDGTWLNFAVADGFAKVQNDKVIVLADAAEEAGQIDLERAERQAQRAKERLEMYQQGLVPEGEEVDPYREELALRRAKNRLKVMGQA
ncbi:MAG: F0F1 ATP synthase subunit epsilon [Thermoleophilia bacterium]